MTAYERHVKYINDYVLFYGRGRDMRPTLPAARNDYDVIEDEHRFVWEARDHGVMTWEKELSRAYYDKLFKEYAVADLGRYRENKIALRWRTQQEVFQGLGQFLCGHLGCGAKDMLQSWQVNFAYQERGERRTALVKLRLCPGCSAKLNFGTAHDSVSQKPDGADSDGARGGEQKSKKVKRHKKHKKSSKNRQEREDAATSAAALDNTGSVDQLFGDMFQ